MCIGNTCRQWSVCASACASRRCKCVTFSVTAVSNLGARLCGKDQLDHRTDTQLTRSNLFCTNTWIFWHTTDAPSASVPPPVSLAQPRRRSASQSGPRSPNVLIFIGVIILVYRYFVKGRYTLLLHSDHAVVHAPRPRAPGSVALSFQK